MQTRVWWMRAVGGFYLLLTLMNVYILGFNSDYMADTLPFDAGPNGVRAFNDAWMVFIAELGVLGAMLVYGSTRAGQAGLLILTVVLAEVFRGVVADAIWINRGYSAGSYGAFIVVHLVIITTGVLALRRGGQASTPGG
ncbi:MAG: hypothetical protein EPO65_13650 [Dehalococcoidia bacterium]|nr:MAG: hypothetical protein EPO65_13650 [Dehalococcoidia bacterium]